MRKLHILKTLIDFFFIILLFTAFGMLVLLSLLLFSGENFDLPVVVHGNKVEMAQLGGRIVMVFSVVAYGLFVYTIYLFKRIVRLFVQTKIFHHYIIKSFNRIGICFILICLMLHVPRFIYRINHGRIEFDLIGDLLNSFWFLLIIGLFFMVLSSIFKIAKNAKEENELTV